MMLKDYYTYRICHFPDMEARHYKQHDTFDVCPECLPELTGAIMETMRNGKGK